MSPFTLPFELCAKSMRMAGYVIESQLRVAQVFGEAAISSNPFYPRAKGRAAACSVAKAMPKAAPAAARRSVPKAVAAPVTSGSASKARGPKEKTSPKAVTISAKPKAKLTVAKQAKPSTSGKHHQPSKPPAMPEMSSPSAGAANTQTGLKDV